MPQAKTLVVDDDPDLVRAMRLRLRANNYKVLPCAMAMAQSAQKDRPSLDRSRFGPSGRRRLCRSGTAAEQRYARGCSGLSS
jgi:hypothetical protein